jgi:hypothetical protein
LLAAASLAAWTQSDLAEGIRLGSAALEADPNPADALDCLPVGAAIGAFAFGGQFEEALALARRALPRPGSGADRWNLAVMQASVVMVLGISGKGAGNDEFEQAAEESIALAHSIANPTALGYAYSAFGTGATESARRVLSERVRSYANEVDNRWLLTMAAVAVATTPPLAAPDDAALATVFDAAEDLHRTGWPTHAWCAMWGVIDGLFDLGHTEASAMVVGACQSSGVSPLGYQRVPPELESDSPRTASFRHLGAELPFDDLVAVVAGRRPLPLLP